MKTHTPTSFTYIFSSAPHELYRIWANNPPPGDTKFGFCYHPRWPPALGWYLREGRVAPTSPFEANYSLVLWTNLSNPEYLVCPQNGTAHKFALKGSGNGHRGISNEELLRATRRPTLRSYSKSGTHIHSRGSRKRKGCELPRGGGSIVFQRSFFPDRGRFTKYRTRKAFPDMIWFERKRAIRKYNVRL